jgi:rhomboid protease GluP
MPLLDDFLRLFGTNRTKLRWKWRSWREGASRQGRSVQNSVKAVAYEHQVCPSCRHPASKDDEVCSRCGQRLLGVTRQRAGRVLAGFVPEGVPLVTVVYLVVCAALFLLSLKVTSDLRDPLAEGGPSSSPTTLALIRLGGNHPFWTISGEEWWRLVTANFLHGGILHLVMNAYGLWVSGKIVEELFGRARALVAYIVTGVAGAALSAFMSFRNPPPWPVSIGASTAAFGLMGLVLAVALRRRRSPWAAQLRATFVPWLLYGLLMTFAISNIDVYGHLGGLGAGFLLGLVLRPGDEKRLPAGVWTALALVTLAGVGACLAMAGQFTLPAELIGGQ